MDLLEKADPSYLESFGLTGTFFSDIKDKFQETVSIVFDREVRANTSHAQKWDVGGFASVHSDNSDNDGNPNAFEINKYVAILYLNDDYEGGNLYFPQHDISFKPNAYSLYTFPGGVENLHGVSEITKGTRYTMVSFWDFADLEYNQDTLDRWDEEVKQVRIEQAKQKEEWAKGIK
jgi:predicted 2-oxoglutarate/Fe(II)-dependent dioxygenase YbiX